MPSYVLFPVNTGAEYCSCPAMATDTRKIEVRSKIFDGSMKAMA